MKIVHCLALIAFVAAFSSCRVEKLDVPFEPTKDITGNWKITKVTRNGTDLTTRFDFTAFRINFKDSAYALTNPVPFLVNTNGNWHFDDPNYPFRIALTAKDSATKTSLLLYPVVAGKRNLILTISPGCTLNAYQYTLEKAN